MEIARSGEHESGDVRGGTTVHDVTRAQVADVTAVDDESGVATTNTRNTNGILGGWATVGGTDWAANATDADNGSIVAYTGYTDVDAQGGSITSAATSNVRINAPGSSGPITLAAGTTDINTLLQATATAATIDTAGKSLRLGAAGGILVLGRERRGCRPGAGPLAPPYISRVLRLPRCCPLSPLEPG